MRLGPAGERESPAAPGSLAGATPGRDGPGAAVPGVAGTPPPEPPRRPLQVFAAGAQDGQCVVWDARDRRPVAKYRGLGAVRSVKFSSGPMDLLAFAEQEGRAHVVDTRMWCQAQVARVPGGGSGLRENPTAGMSFSPDGTGLLLACETAVYLWDVDTDTRLTFADASVL